MSSLCLTNTHWVFFVENNPLSYSDPMGLAPCSLDLEYCVIIEEGPYHGFFIDTDHWQGGNTVSKTTDQFLHQLKGKFFGKFVLRADLFRATIYYTRTYLTHLPQDLPDSVLDEITLGIMEDFEAGLESFEGIIDPACWATDDWTIFIPGYGLHRCSSFSNEDLPSVYLGYVAFMKNWDFKEVVSQFVKNVEVGTMGTNEFPADIAESFSDARNYCFTPKILDVITGQYKNVPWPPSIPTYPSIGPGQEAYWWPYWMINR